MTILLDQENPLNGPRSAMLNLKAGGQNGAMMVPTEVMNNAAYMKQRVIPFMLTFPGLFRFMDSPEDWGMSLKHLIEVQKQAIDGLNSTHNWEFDDRQIGNSGEVLAAVSRGSREVSRPSYRWKGLRAASIERYWTEYGRLFLMDPDLGAPGIVSHEKYIRAGSPAILPSDQSFAVLYVEPDETLTRPVHAWLVANHMPNTGGEIIGRFETHYQGENPEISIEFTGTSMPPSKPVYQLARNLLMKMNFQGLRPTESVAMYGDRAPDVQAADTGWLDKIDKVTENV